MERESYGNFDCSTLQESDGTISSDYTRWIRFRGYLWTVFSMNYQGEGMQAESLHNFQKIRDTLCQEHELHTESVSPQDRSFEALMARFVDGDLEVTLHTSWRDEDAQLHTLSLHKNATGRVLLALDSPRGRRYHFPAVWMGARSQPSISEVEVNAWSRFSSTPDGRPTGYKQQRFSRTPALYFRGERIIGINKDPVRDAHVGKALYQALQTHPDGVRLTLECR